MEFMSGQMRLHRRWGHKFPALRALHSFSLLVLFDRLCYGSRISRCSGPITGATQSFNLLIPARFRNFRVLFRLVFLPVVHFF